MTEPNYTFRWDFSPESLRRDGCWALLAMLEAPPAPSRWHPLALWRWGRDLRNAVFEYEVAA